MPFVLPVLPIKHSGTDVYVIPGVSKKFNTDVDTFLNGAKGSGCVQAYDYTLKGGSILSLDKGKLVNSNDWTRHARQLPTPNGFTILRVTGDDAFRNHWWDQSVADNRQELLPLYAPRKLLKVSA